MNTHAVERFVFETGRRPDLIQVLGMGFESTANERDLSEQGVQLTREYPVEVKQGDDVKRFKFIMSSHRVLPYEVAMRRFISSRSMSIQCSRFGRWKST